MVMMEVLMEVVVGVGEGEAEAEGTEVEVEMAEVMTGVVMVTVVVVETVVGETVEVVVIDKLPMPCMRILTYHLPNIIKLCHVKHLGVQLQKRKYYFS